MKEKDDLSIRYSLDMVAIMGMTLALTIVSITSSAQADSINPGVFSIDAKPYNVSYAEWTARWWQWVFSIPEEDNPNNDHTGEKCAIGQEGPVWFLAPSFGGTWERTCIMPTGKAVLFPILTGECDYFTNPDAKTEVALLKCAMECQGGGEKIVVIGMDVVVDQVKLKNLEKYRVQSQPFKLTVPAKNVFGTPVQGDNAFGITTAVVDGFYVFLEHLSPGKHDIHFRGNVIDPSIEGQCNYATDITYHLIVKPP